MPDAAAPGSGRRPGDPATTSTPVARSAPEVTALAFGASSLEGGAGLDACVSVCRACPRLVEWREQVARQRRRSFAEQEYWGRPIPGWGSPEPRVLVVGLAPAAHGGNRTGRIFTGDRSGDWLFRSLHRAGLAGQESAVSAGDGQRLLGTRMLAAVRCAPPGNRPTPAERVTCAPWLVRELSLVLPSVRVVLALGSFAWVSVLSAMADLGVVVPRPRPAFGHAVEVPLRAGHGGLILLACYHPSQQNTFTGRLTEGMLDAITGRAALIAGG